MKTVLNLAGVSRILCCALAAAVFALGGCIEKTSVQGDPSFPADPEIAYSSPEMTPPAPVLKSPAGTKPYTIGGKTYKPILDAQGYSEEGIASWYGQDFHGKTTASGEVYDMNAMTAAHKLLPFGTQLKVTNLNNNRSIVVRINDRGPFVGNRVIDLSRKGAAELDMLTAGTAPVRIVSVGSIPGQRGDDLAGNFYIQIGSFSQKDNAHNLAKSLQKKGGASRVVHVPQIGFYRVQAGPYRGLLAAEAASLKLKEEFPNNFVLAE